MRRMALVSQESGYAKARNATGYRGHRPETQQIGHKIVNFLWPIELDKIMFDRHN